MQQELGELGVLLRQLDRGGRIGRRVTCSLRVLFLRFCTHRGLSHKEWGGVVHVSGAGREGLLGKGATRDGRPEGPSLRGIQGSILKASSSIHVRQLAPGAKATPHPCALSSETRAARGFLRKERERAGLPFRIQGLSVPCSLTQERMRSNFSQVIAWPVSSRWCARARE